jgi:hypothetical protein
VGKIRRIEIRIRTRQTLEIARGVSVTRERCAGCGETVEMVRLSKAALDNESLRAGGIEVNRDELHALEMPDGSLLVCLKSLME